MLNHSANWIPIAPIFIQTLPKLTMYFPISWVNMPFATYDHTPHMAQKELLKKIKVIFELAHF
jgi:hypothetical protein